MDFSGHHQAADMSSADLFEYLLNTDNDATFTSLFPTPDTLLPSTSNSNFPAVVSPQPPPPPQQQQQQRPIAPATMLLPKSSVSYRQISPSMPPPSNPTHIAIAPAPQLQSIAPATATRPTAAAAPVHIKPILPKAAPSTASCIATATAVPTSASALISPAFFSSGSSVHSSTSIPPSEDIWKERFQQLQQLQQTHRHKQHQLLSAAILSSPTPPTLAPFSTPAAAAVTSSSSRTSQSSSTSSQRSSSSERSVSPEKTTPDKLRTIYPSPPMNDDMAMESDSEARFGHGSEFAKPTESQLKLMTSKERRQLRNKLSARNFRVRRKEYIDHLENEVKLAKQETADIQRRLIQSELNCQFLRQELEATRLSQSLFGSGGIGGDGRMSKEHANLLASLLNPNTETFPTVSNTETVQPLASASWMDASLASAVGTSTSGELATGAGSGTVETQSTVEEGQMPMEPFVPFDDWPGLLINRAEVSEPVVDPKDTSATTTASGEAAQGPAHELLARYEALKREAEHDAQMRAEIKADTDRRLLAQTYMVVPKGGDRDSDAMTIEVKRRLEEDSVVLKSLIYMLMVQLTESLFEAATLSKTDLVRMYQSMDEPLRAKMLAQAKECSTTNKFAEWREGWIKRCWPSYYNNRRRVVELINRSGICDPCYRAKELKEKEIEEIARKMEEAVKDQTVGEMCKPNFFYKTFVPDRFKCPGVLAYEKIEAEAKAAAKASMMQQEQKEMPSTRAAMAIPMPVTTSVACA